MGKDRTIPPEPPESAVEADEQLPDGLRHYKDARRASCLPQVEEHAKLPNQKEWPSDETEPGHASRDEVIDVLLLHRSMDAGDINAGITAALVVGAVSADVVAVEARRHATISSRGGASSDRHPGAHSELKVQRVVSLTQRRLMDPASVIAGLPPDSRPLPSVNAYDELLAKRTEHPAGTASKENIS